jgi:4-amino-4-deoxy-L-arabinose transferase-like glycosyltransferase
MRNFFSVPIFMPQYWAYLALLILTLSHLPFIKADADYELSWSRGPWTDEGLYASQIRNLLQHHDLSLDKSDALIKTPLFSALLYTSYQLFGISLVVSRLTVLLITILLLFFIAKINAYTSKWILLSIPITFLQYYIFQYSHLALTEILSSVCILAGVFFFYKAFGGGNLIL